MCYPAYMEGFPPGHYVACVRFPTTKPRYSVFQVPVLSEVRVPTEGQTNRKTVVILGGDPVVGRALELLLRNAHYDVRYVNTNSPESPPAPENVGGVVLGPGWNSRIRKAVLKVIGDAPDMENIPVLEIGLPTDDARLRAEHYVPWPCRSEELKKRLDDVL